MLSPGGYEFSHSGPVLRDGHSLRAALCFHVPPARGQHGAALCWPPHLLAVTNSCSKVLAALLSSHYSQVIAYRTHCPLRDYNQHTSHLRKMAAVHRVPQANSHLKATMHEEPTTCGEPQANICLR